MQKITTVTDHRRYLCCSQYWISTFTKSSYLKCILIGSCFQMYSSALKFSRVRFLFVPF